MPTTNGKKIPYFDNHGAVLNLEGFPGEVIFENNLVKNNMYFIRDVFPSFRSNSDVTRTLSQFVTDNQVQMIICADSGLKTRFFGDYLTSLTEQDSAALSKLEKHSAIYISKPEWPLRFENNIFSGNVGTFGGAISINNPIFKNQTTAELDCNRITENLACPVDIATKTAAASACDQTISVYTVAMNDAVVLCATSGAFCTTEVTALSTAVDACETTIVNSGAES